MKTLLLNLRGALVSTLVLAIVCCGLYPFAVTLLAQALFPRQANGSLIVEKNGSVRGSALLGQGFTGAAYFHPRPSAAGAHGYDGASSSGSNLGPTSQKLRDAIQERVTAYRTVNGLAADVPVPADAVTASGSGLDPHISPENAALQSARVARERGLDAPAMQKLIEQNTDAAGLGFLGGSGVNVLRLNLALDALTPPIPGSRS